jgi:glutathione S-transferase
VRDAVVNHRRLLEMMDTSLARGPWLAGEAFSLADAAVIPYILRLELLRLHRMWERLPRIDAWYERMRSRESVKKELLERMRPEDRAPFDKLEVDAWSKVEKLAWEC